MKNSHFVKSQAIWMAALLLLGACKRSREASPAAQDLFTVAFGSCNRTELPNPFWEAIVAAQPDVWIWGGDVVYADTDSIPLLRQAYARQDTVAGYRLLRERVPVLGTWDDHDYGINDGGAEFQARAASQQAFLDFLQVAADDPRRSREGVYGSRLFERPGGSVKVFLLDTRYFRSPLTPDPSGKLRYVPNPPGQGTMLGEAQWRWLAKELQESEADFNLLVSSVQLLSDRHGFEGWGNMPQQRDRLLQLIEQSGARGVVVLSGDRHFSEFSRLQVPGMRYPLIDFTSSGLTHAYSAFDGEPNPYRVGEVVPRLAFGLIRLDLKALKAEFQIVGEGGQVLGSLQQVY